MDATEVTNAQYAAFLASSPSTSGQDAWCSWNTTFEPPFGWPATGKENYPVVRVDWCDAFAYCKWAGKRLCGNINGGANAYGDYADPTMSQWHNACSAGGGKSYPYGSTYSGTACNGVNSGEGSSLPVASKTMCEGGYPGLFDLSGNVLEWEDSCSGMAGGQDLCRYRGGSFLDDAASLKCSDGSGVADRSYRGTGIGFRCCRN